jgi:hypothetical protein
MQRRLLVGLLAVTHCNAEESYAQSLSITLARARRNAAKFDRSVADGWKPTASAAGAAFAQSVWQEPALDGCTPAGYARIEERALNLTAAAMALHVGFGNHGQWGIFDKNYLGVKTRFINHWLCKYQRQKRPIRHICELGFMAGHSALLFLETVPGARVVSFDMADNRWTLPMGALLKCPERRHRTLAATSQRIRLAPHPFVK